MGLCFLHGQIFSKTALEKEDVHFIHSLTEAVLKGTRGWGYRNGTRIPAFKGPRVTKESET